MMKAIIVKFPVNTVIHTLELNFFIHCYVDVVSARGARKLHGES